MEVFANQTLSQINLEAASKFVVNGKTGDALARLTKEWEKTHGTWQATLWFTNYAFDGDTVNVQFRLRLQDHLFNKMTHDEHLTLQKRGTNWKIVPLEPDAIHRPKGDGYNSEILLKIASYLAYPREVDADLCMTNLKQFALYSFQYLNDFDDKFAFKADAFLRAFKPYMRDETQNYCPDDTGGGISYSFNANLENATFGKITKAEQTVMLYEGKNEQLEFRHDNRAVVAFADGHIELIAPESAKTLKWKP